MTKEQKALIKATVPVLQEHGVLLTKHFYQRMFTHNPELKNMFNLGNQQNGKQQTALAMAVLAYAEQIDNPGVLMPVINTIGHKHTSLDIRPEHYHIVGKHLLASISEVLGPDATPELLAAWKVAYEQLAKIMSGHESTLYSDQVNKTGGWSGWRPFIVKDKVRESAEITSFFLYPADGGTVADFIPGQYISIRMFLPQLNLSQPRQYSISSMPNGTYYRISVKKETGSSHPSGIISNTLHDEVKIGDKIDVSAPAGTFMLDSDRSRPLYFVSGGVGLTPLMSMLETALKDNPGQQKTWIHGCKSSDAHAFKRCLAEWNNKYNELDCHIFYDEAAPVIAAMRQYQGWVDLGLISGIPNQKADYYLCGPAAFIKKHYDFLTEQGVPKEAIRFEEFGPASLEIH
ncbi:NO-inducible flavohemoprotein [Taibaiella chishuiensis]|uniref:Flavohemoprotein n=1 Tax=Taibaiella chishuiensis TaxID=1434707 RepID=A0A2P8DDF0_9BACT|nr:NO-inducible flavohemoprotein [Taibaiella chishuiensis]PSK95236.1 nitric oxide dioxygenase [Taibaiella chishuiensis]